MPTASTRRFYADDPIDGTEQNADLLGRESYASQVVSLLGRVHVASESSVLGLIGPWGSGKSSVLQMVKNGIAANQDWSIAEFNPWAYSDLASMLLGFFEELVAALPEDSRSGDTRRRIGRLIQKISPIGKAGGLVGLDAEGALGAIGNLVAGDGSASAERLRIDAILRSQNRPVLVLIDDLDRLSPTELLLVFKLVRFLGRLPNVYYILSYDERTLLDVLALTELCGGNTIRARDYLEKIVQVRLDVPPMLQGAARELLYSGVVSILGDEASTVHESLDSRFWPIYDVAMNTYLQTPRSINRYLAQLAAFWGPDCSNTKDWVDYALLTFLRTFEPLAYSLIWRSKKFLAVSEPVGTGSREPTSDYGRFVAALSSATSITPGSELAAIQAVVGQVFLPVSSTTGDRITSKHIQQVTERQGAGTLNSFDRYFTFEAPS